MLLRLSKVLQFHLLPYFYVAHEQMFSDARADKTWISRSEDTSSLCRSRQPLCTPKEDDLESYGNKLTGIFSRFGSYTAIDFEDYIQ